MSERPEQNTPKDALKAVLRHRWLLLLGASLFSIVAMLVSHYIPLKYSSSAMFERRSDAATQGIGANSESFGTMRLTLRYELSGPKAIERAIEDLGLTRQMPQGVDGQLTPAGQKEKQILIAELAKNMNVTWPVQSSQVDRIVLNFTHSDRSLAEQLPNILVKNYINWVSAQMIQRIRNSQDFLQAQIDKHKSRLGELVSKKIAFQAKHGNISLADPGELQDRIKELTAAIDASHREQNIAEKKLSAVQTTIRQTKRNHTKRQLSELKDRLDQQISVAGMTYQHPAVQNISKRIAQLEKRMKETPDVSVLSDEAENDPLLRNMAVQLAVAQTDVQGIRANRDRLVRRRDRLKAVVADATSIRQEYFKIVDPIKEEQVQLTQWQKRLTNGKMALDAEIANRRTQLSSIQPARKPIKPLSPQLWMVLGLALGGGLLFGYGLTFVADTVNCSITCTKDAAEYFDAPIHGVISEIMTPGQWISRHLRRRALTSVVSLVLLAALGLSVLSVVLRLRYPEQYKQWLSSPSGYVYDQVIELAQTQSDIELE